MNMVKTYTLTDTAFGHRTERSVTIEKHGGYGVKCGAIAGFLLACITSTMQEGDEPVTDDEYKDIADMSARMASSMQHGDLAELRKDAELLGLALDVAHH